MVCVICRAPVIGGSIPVHLRNSGRCAKCYPSYIEEQQINNQEKVLVEQKLKEVEEQKAKDEEIENRFDILDI